MAEQTQLRASAAHTGARYGSFGGRGGARDVGALTQCRASGACTGMRYGSFAGRAPVVRRILTQCRAFGASTGARYGDFGGREPTPPQPSPDDALEPKLLGRSRQNRQRLYEEEQQRMALARQIVVLAIAQVIASEVLDG